ncbi:hypothetical protein SMICM304S_10663 [Streptomyces microflavus]
MTITEEKRPAAEPGAQPRPRRSAWCGGWLFTGAFSVVAVLLALLGYLGEGVAGGDVDWAGLLAKVILVPQTPVVFGGSILDNALFGLRHVMRAPRQVLGDRAEQALKEAGLWRRSATGWTLPLRRCPPDSASASASRERSPWSRPHCSSTSPPVPWTNGAGTRWRSRWPRCAGAVPCSSRPDHPAQVDRPATVRSGSNCPVRIVAVPS